MTSETPAPAAARPDPDPDWEDGEVIDLDDTAPADPSHPAFDTSIAHQARMYDYWLGGKDNFEADRKAGDAVIQSYPGIVSGARANRAFLGRAVRYLAGEAEVRQFLDIGTGIPTSGLGNTHEVAQRVAPEARVVYVDNDPVVLSYAYALLKSGPQGATDYLDADLRNPAAILDRAARTLDLSQPVAVILLMILHAIGDHEDPYAMVASIMSAVPSGSYLLISHPAVDVEPDKAVEARDRANELSYQQYTLRSRAEVMRFFQGLEMTEPGLVQLQQWRPEPGADTSLSTWAWCGLGRKP